MLDLVFIIGLKSEGPISYHPTQRTVPVASMYNYLKDKLQVKVYIAEFFDSYDSIPEAKNYAVSFFNPEILYFQQLAKFLKARNPDSLILAGGMGVAVRRGTLLQEVPELNFFILGDGLDPMIDIFLKGTPYQEHPCATYEGHIGKKSLLSSIPSSNLIYNEDAFVPWDKEIIGKKESKMCLALLSTTSGCPFQCYFCANSETYGQKAQYRDIEIQKNDIKLLLQDPATRNIYFTDPICNVPDPQRIKTLRAVFQAALDNGLDPNKHTFQFFCRPQYVTHENDKFRELLIEFGDKIPTEIFLGLENFDQRGLDALGKKEKAENFYRVFEDLREVKGLNEIAGTLIFGFPGDNDDILQTNIDYTLRIMKRYRETNSKVKLNINAVPLQIIPYTYFYEHRFDWPQYFTGEASDITSNLLQENKGLVPAWFNQTLERLKKFNEAIHSALIFN